MDIFDGILNGMPGIEQYRGWVVPDLYPEVREPVWSNWSSEEIWDFCGGRT
jgi:hypothetical protein